MSKYFQGVYKAKSNSICRNSLITEPPRHEVAIYLLSTGSISKESISKTKYYLYKFFKQRYKRKKVFCLECENSYQAICKNDKVVSPCPFCEDWWWESCCLKS